MIGRSPRFADRSAIVHWRSTRACITLNEREGILVVASVAAFFGAFVWAGAAVRTGRALPLLFFGGIAIFVVVALFSLMTELRFCGVAGAIGWVVGFVVFTARRTLA